MSTAEAAAAAAGACAAACSFRIPRVRGVVYDADSPQNERRCEPWFAAPLSIYCRGTAADVFMPGVCFSPCVIKVDVPNMTIIDLAEADRWDDLGTALP